MEIVSLEVHAAPVALNLIKKSFKPLLEKYRDFDYNPATKSLECLITEISYPTSDTYLLKEEEFIGYLRVNKRDEGIYSISDLCIDPCYQGNGYAQYFLHEIEKIYTDAKSWSLVTILEEKKDCYLYEKMGYTRKHVIKEISSYMHFVLYTKDMLVN